MLGVFKSLEFTWTYITASAFWILLGFLFAGIIMELVPTKKIAKHLGGKGLVPILKSSVMGIPMPLCSCGVVPTGIALNKSGASEGASVTFLISVPETSVTTLILTNIFLGPIYMVYRLISAIATSIGGGIVGNKIGEGGSESDGGWINLGTGSWRGVIRYGFVDMMAALGPIFLGGFLAAGVVDALIPKAWIVTWLGSPGIESLLLAALIALPIYACAIGTVPFVASLIYKGMAPGAGIIFLLLGPATNYETLLAIKSQIGTRTLVAYLSSLVAGTLFFGLLFNQLCYLYPALASLVTPHLGAAGLLPSPVKMASGLLLVSLLIYGSYLWFKARI